MSLGLFNCRLIQPAGDQLFFLSAVLLHRCQFGKVLFSPRVTHPARPRPAGGRRMLLVFPSQKVLVLVFQRGKVRRMQKGSLPPLHRRIFPEDPPNPTHRFCYRAAKESGRSLPGICTAQSSSPQSDYNGAYGPEVAAQSHRRIRGGIGWRRVLRASW